MTNQTTTLPAEKRDTKVNLNSIRKEDGIPANIYGAGIESQAITIKADAFKVAFNEAGETGIISMDLGEKAPRNVLISDIQYHPVTDEILHVDFRQVDLSQKITAQVPVELIGEAPVEKNNIGILVQHTNELEVEALPLDLPESFDIDITKLETLEDFITVADIKVDSSKIEILAEDDQVIVNSTEIRKEEEPVVTEESEETSEEASQEESKSEESSEEDSE